MSRDRSAPSNPRSGPPRNQNEQFVGVNALSINREPSAVRLQQPNSTISPQVPHTSTATSSVTPPLSPSARPSVVPHSSSSRLPAESPRSFHPPPATAGPAEGAKFPNPTPSHPSRKPSSPPKVVDDDSEDDCFVIEFVPPRATSPFSEHKRKRLTNGKNCFHARSSSTLIFV